MINICKMCYGNQQKNNKNSLVFIYIFFTQIINYYKVNFCILSYKLFTRLLQNNK